MPRNSLISEYQSALRALRDGRFDVAVPADPGDEIGKLGHELNGLAQALEERYKESVRVREISEKITAGLFLDDVLDRVYTSFQSIIPYSRMGCALLNSEKNKATAYWERSDAPKVKLRTGHTAAMAGSSLQQVIETGQPRILNDLEAYLAEHPDSSTTRLIVEEGMRSSLTCPLIAQGNRVGFIFFSSREKNTYRDIHQDVFLQIAGQVSILVEKSRLYEQLYEFNQKLLLAQHELKHRATHDSLTGIHNHGAIVEHLTAQLAKAARMGTPLAVIMLDADHFKQINDTHGHHAGDVVLKTIAGRMKKCLREYDYLGRYGGEEFLAVLGDADQETALRIAERMNRAISEEAVAFGDERIAVTLSAGVAVAADCTRLATDEIVAAADRELYRAKANGRNRVEACRM